MDDIYEYLEKCLKEDKTINIATKSGKWYYDVTSAKPVKIGDIRIEGINYVEMQASTKKGDIVTILVKMTDIEVVEQVAK